MIRSLVILSVFIASYTYGQQFTTERRYFDDFAGQEYCAKRKRNGEDQCCRNRIDECSVPIAGTLCYCDEFCDQHINPDCCPDYEPVCKGIYPPIVDPIVEKCNMTIINDHNKIEEIFITSSDEKKINCNLCKCGPGAVLNCEKDFCLSDTDMIHNINNHGSQLGWKAMNYSEFYGKKLSEGLTYRLGTMEPRNKVKSMSRLGHLTSRLPDQFDSRTVWRGFISEIVDQKWCGSSWAVSTASVASDRMAVNLKKKQYLSSQNLLSCVKHKRGCNGACNGCTGGHLDNAWRYLNKIGIADDKCYPYEADVGRCRVKKGDNLRKIGCTVSNNERESFYKMGPAYSLNNETDIMWEISTYGPVQATMWVYPDLFSYQEGIYRKSNFVDHKPKGFHSVRLIGWGEESNGHQTAKYWIAANSWGEWWGEGGYFRIARGTNECGIEDYVLAAMVDHQDIKTARNARSYSKRSYRKAV